MQGVGLNEARKPRSEPTCDSVLSSIAFGWQRFGVLEGCLRVCCSEAPCHESAQKAAGEGELGQLAGRRRLLEMAPTRRTGGVHWVQIGAYWSGLSSRTVVGAVRPDHGWELSSLTAHVEHSHLHVPAVQSGRNLSGLTMMPTAPDSAWQVARTSGNVRNRYRAAACVTSL
eukprot:6875006-Lingulodinium_polyedra.AAC.1